MFKEDYYKNKRVTSGFGVDRGAYKHSGVDYCGTKQDDVLNQLNGVVYDLKQDNAYFGKQCVVMSNPRYLDGVDEFIYHSYCHLDSVFVKKNEFIAAGALIGKMGNSGFCYTRYNKNSTYNGVYRMVTESEQSDKNCHLGVHLHLWFYQPCQAGRKTRLLNILKKLHIVSDQTQGDTHFYQWSKLILAPRVIYSYLQTLIRS